LTGRYDFRLEYAGGAGIGGMQQPPDLFTEQGATAPSLAAALDKQLGLKLEKATATLEMLVIDHVEKTPTEN
jgi:uncharacterized protein (TIGR03435 family)